MFTKEESREKIRELTESFGDKLEYIKTSGQYKEAQIEDEFIKPLFRYLNWNTSNEGIQNPSDREFIVQPKGRDGKEPDYLLSLDRKPRFYMEAKHSKYWLFKETKYIWQAYQYAYSTQSLSPSRKIDFALLTDFEEFRFFDCTFPVKNQSTLNNFVSVDWLYTDYIKKFDQLWDHFERENVRKGSLEKLYLNEKKVKENRIPPDKAFLKDLDDEKDGWRIKLAKEIKKLQPEFSAEFITQSVQLILDRFIFIKVLIDREIEEDCIQKIVTKIQNAKDKEEGIVYEECKDIFETLDKTYNGSIFSQRNELDSVRVGNKILLEVLKDFLPENSRYNFKIIPVEILGTIYEQFLGKVVVTTDKRATIEYKPEVRKAGGVYYTPAYIVNYIVEKTVGEKLKSCNTLDDMLSLKVCDPACGSGSFLIAAYDTLIKWTIEFYTNKKLTKEEQKLVYKSETDGHIRLSQKIKRDILRSCIFGVDIDPQAVEVTRMSLSLKTLEDTDHNQVYDERTLWHTTILPPLEGNIKCGNSLIGTDIYKQQDLFTLGDKEKHKINAFDWETEYPVIFKAGGFDVVIGNPPYLYSAGKNYLEYFKLTYKLSQYQTDYYVYFIEKTFFLLNKVGSKFSFIVSDAWLNSQHFSSIRNYILTKHKLDSITVFGYPVFEKVALENSIFVISCNATPAGIPIYKFLNPSENFLLNKIVPGNAIKKGIIDPYTSAGEELLFSKIETTAFKLGEVFELNRGIHAYRTDGYGKSKFSAGYQTKKDKEMQSYHADQQIDSTYLPEFKGKDVFRYYQKFNELYISYGHWLAEPREAKYFYNPKIVLRKILGKRLNGHYFEKPAAIDQSLYIIIEKETQTGQIPLLHTLGILLSGIGAWYLRKKHSIYDTLYPWYTKKQLENFPLKFVDYQINEKVISMLDLNKKLQGAKTQHEKDSLQRQIDATDREIDKLVYALYELTPEEIAIVEGKE